MIRAMRFLRYLVLLACLPACGATLPVNWTIPAVNADGTALTDLAGYRILYGTSPSNLSQTVTLTNSALTNYTLTVPAGTWFVSMVSVNSAGTPSAFTNIASATVTDPPPPPPLAVSGPYGYEITGTTAAPTMSAIGLVQGGAPCGTAVRIVGAIKFCQIAISQIDVVGWPLDKTLAKGVWAKAQ